MLEFTHCDLFADDVHIVGEVNLLHSLDGISGKNANDRCHNKDCPETCLSVDLLSSSVELSRGCKGGIDTSPEEDEQVTQYDNEQHDPIPTIGVDENVEVDCEHSRVCNIATKPDTVLYVEAVTSDKVGVDECEVRDKEYHDTLVDSIDHVEPVDCYD